MAPTEPTPEEIEARRRQTRERVAAHRARKRQQEAEARGEAATPPAPRRTRSIELITPQDRALIDEYLAARATELLDASRQAYETDLADFALDLKLGLLGASRTDISLYLDERTRDPKNPTDPRPLSRRSARRKLSSLAGFYHWLLDEERISRDPTRRVRIARDVSEVPLRMSKALWEQLIQHVEDRITHLDDRRRALYVLDALLLRLMYHLALRVTEAHTIRLSKIRYEDGELRAQIVKKGDKVRSYPLTGIVRDAYDRWMGVRDEIEIQPGHEDFLIVHPWFRKRTGRKRAWRRLQRLAQDAGLPKQFRRHLSPHTLRHARAYHMVEDGYSLTDVQSMLDHANIATTQIYTQHDEIARMRILRAASTV